MLFGFMNIFGLVTMALMLFPNIIYAIRSRGKKQEYAPIPKFVDIAEQIGRYGSFVFMIVNITDEGLSSLDVFAVWLVLTLVLVAMYYVFWILYSKRISVFCAVMLAVLPSIIFIMTGVFWRDWLLLVSGLVFAPSHIYITVVNARLACKRREEIGTDEN